MQAAGPPVIVSARKRLMVLDPARSTWDPRADPSVVKWSFDPRHTPGYADLQPDRTWTPNEAKVRSWRGKTYVLTSASKGFAAVVEYPSKKRYWGATLGAGTSDYNPHSVELLPNGDVAVASSAGNEGVALFARSQGPAPKWADRVRITGAHGLYWDAGRKRLWALGSAYLVAFRIGGTAAHPKLIQDKALGGSTPTPNGHDLGPVAGHPGRMWVATGSHVYQYDQANPEKQRWITDYPGSGVLLGQGGVKSVMNDPVTGRIVFTVPYGTVKTNPWQHTRTARLLLPKGAYVIKGDTFYKARWFRALPVG
ncbi:hypothetical protein J3486_35285 [Streptomyces sp. VRA16 Mangrove soil]|nr:hypothetical protein [Streptomyces sp. VRA16 Mangrove soil]